jgi:undecaprenyl-diphosphatase
MGWLQIIVLAIVQGLTEFLPISSSGHLILVPAFLEWSDQGLSFDVAVHFGSLMAVLIFFRNDIEGLFHGARDILASRGSTLQARMAWCIGIGTIPAAIAGLLLAGWIAANVRSALVVVATLSAYGVLMALADRYAPRDRDISQIRIKDAVVIGMAQALALVPGTSRSGITITAARLLGIRRQDAARFSFVLAAPVILIATIYEGVKLVTGDMQVAWENLAVAALISGVVAYLSIDFFMRFVSALGLLPFAIYRVILAGVILYVLYY